MKHLALGGILLIIGLSIISPLEEGLILVLGFPSLVIIINVVAILCLLGAIYLLGLSKVTGPFHKHWKMAVIGVIIFIAAIYVYYM